MRVKDKYGSILNIYQARNGKIYIAFAELNIYLSKNDAEKFSLYDIDGFDAKLYNKAYN